MGCEHRLLLATTLVHLAGPFESGMRFSKGLERHAKPAPTVIDVWRVARWVGISSSRLRPKKDLSRLFEDRGYFYSVIVHTVLLRILSSTSIRQQ